MDENEFLEPINKPKIKVSVRNSHLETKINDIQQKNPEKEVENQELKWNQILTINDNTDNKEFLKILNKDLIEEIDDGNGKKINNFNEERIQFIYWFLLSSSKLAGSFVSDLEINKMKHYFYEIIFKFLILNILFNFNLFINFKKSFKL